MSPSTTSPAMKRVKIARTSLVMEKPFFASLCLKLKLVEDPSHKTGYTDGRVIGFNPDFVTRQLKTHGEVVTFAAHESMHCGMGHPWRRGHREHRKWNDACDHATNLILKAAGFAMPEGALCDPQWTGKSAEWIYDRLPDDPDGPGRSGSGPGKLGEFVDATTEPDEEGNPPPTEADWEEALQQAAQAAKNRGELPEALERFAKDASRARVDWRSVTLRFAQEVAKADYSWSRPNPRHVSRGLYLPALRNKEMSAMAVGIDTSGSIDQVCMNQFFAQLQSIVDDVQPRRVHVFYCDARVQRTETFERGDPVTCNPKGGGGTKFEPVFDAIAELDEPPACIVYLTDLDGSFPKEDPGIPTLWASIAEKQVPFGEVVLIE